MSTPGGQDRGVQWDRVPAENVWRLGDSEVSILEKGLGD
jgi:hypothetical protein